MIGIIGFGEAGRAFAGDRRWRAYDIDPARTQTATLAEALNGAQLVVSVVTADQALAAAQAASACIMPGALYCDMNSVAPATKLDCGRAIMAAGGRYVDVAVLAPVIPARLDVPLLLAGADSVEAKEVLGQIGFTNVRVLGNEPAKASAVKMIRSVMIKGIEALTAEMMAAAVAADVVEEVLASLDASEKVVSWAERANYNLERMTTHGKRRAAEMEEVAKTLTSLGVEPLMTRGTIVRQREMVA